jgi:signal transduction histidine kinase
MLRNEKLILTCLLFLIMLFSFPILAISQMSVRQIDSMKSKLATAKEDTNKVILLMNLGNETGYTNLKEALSYAMQGYALSIDLNYQKGIGNLAYLTGITYMDLGNYNLSDSFLTIAEQEFLQLNDKRNLAKISDARGAYQFMKGNYLLSANFYSKAAEGFDQLKDSVNALISYQNLIAVLAEIKNYEKAIELGKKVIKMVEPGKDTLQLGYTLQGLVTDLIFANKMEEASLYIDRLAGIGSTIGDQNLASDIYSTLGTYYYHKKEFNKSTNYFTTAVQIAGYLDNKFQLANHYNDLGQALCSSGYFDMAEDSLLKGMSLAKQFDNKRAESNISMSLSIVYDSLKAYHEAFKNLLLHTGLNDSILSSDTRNYTSQLETQYETTKKEKEIAQLKTINTEKELALVKRNRILLLGGIAAIALLFVLGLLYRNTKQKQIISEKDKKIKEEQIRFLEHQQQVVSLQSMINGQETERIRIARDLHDGLGGVFSAVKMHYSTLQHEIPELRTNPLYHKTFDLINNASDELRTVAHNMMPEVLMKVGLIEALKDFCNSISSGKLLNISLQAYCMEKRLSSPTEVMLFRIIQELINNIIKHAYATEAIIQFNREGNRLNITIEDNGRGFDTLETGEKGIGMNTVKSRVDYLNGKLTIDSRIDIGTTVMIDILLNEK